MKSYICEKCNNEAMWTCCAKCWYIKSEWKNIAEIRAEKK